MDNIVLIISLAGLAISCFGLLLDKLKKTDQILEQLRIATDGLNEDILAKFNDRLCNYFQGIDKKTEEMITEATKREIGSFSMNRKAKQQFKGYDKEDLIYIRGKEKRIKYLENYRQQMDFVITFRYITWFSIPLFFIFSILTWLTNKGLSEYLFIIPVFAMIYFVVLIFVIAIICRADKYINKILDELEYKNEIV
ncbi:MAG: hypothetical protein ACLFSQ_04225 [Candidatus Zixiibacteriota bacterium]